jgi:hypothetical protein
MIEAAMSRPTVYLCRGSSCSDARGEKELRERLDQVAEVCEVRCQRICEGPVIGTEVDGVLEWFERLRSKKVQRHVVEWLTGAGKFRRSLRKRRVGKRAGRRR